MNATNKKDLFEESQNSLAAMNKALSHPARIAILQVLIRRNACVCGDIVEELPLAQATVSQHLRELKKAGLIKGNIEGPRICYCIDVDAWKKAQQAMNTFFEAFDPNAGCC